MTRRRLAWSAVFALWCGQAMARDLVRNDAGEPIVELRSSIKGTEVLERMPDDRVLFPDSFTGSSLWRLRVEPTIHPAPWLLGWFTLETRAVEGARLVPGSLPQTLTTLLGIAPFRLSGLDWTLAEGGGAYWRLEIDRAYLSFQTDTFDLTVGRQPVGWGRGLLFGAVDMFSPFTPLETDREWRRGIDALRLDLHLPRAFSLDIVITGAERVEQAAFGARLRGRIGPADAELLAGRRATDLFGGLTASTAIGDAEVHGEWVTFAAPAPDDSVFKAVLGASNRFSLGSGLFLFGEYTYSGFGVAKAQDLGARLNDPAFLTRIARGDIQILGRHAVAIEGIYDVGTSSQLSMLWLFDPTDSSGVIEPGLTWDFAPSVTVIAVLQFPYGKAPVNGVPQSNFGLSSLAGTVQLRLYD